MNTNKTAWTRDRLARLLDAYGADRRRWPPGGDDGLDAFLAHEADARRLVAEAHALDRVLAAAAVTADGPADPVRVDAIVGAALAAAPRSGPAASNVVAFRRRAAPPPPAASRRHELVRAVGLLAASLLLGVYLGIAGVTERMLGAESDAELEQALLTLPAELAGSAEEDTL